MEDKINTLLAIYERVQFAIEREDTDLKRKVLGLLNKEIDKHFQKEEKKEATFIQDNYEAELLKYLKELDQTGRYKSRANSWNAPFEARWCKG